MHSSEGKIFSFGKGGQFAAFDNRSRFSWIEAFPGLCLPTLPLDSNTYVFANGPKGGLAAGVGHEVANEIVNAPDKQKKFLASFRRVLKVSGMHRLG